MPELTLSQIYIYPVKSLRGIALPETELTARGPKWDRRWMLVDRDGRFLSQRERGQMVLFQPQLEAEHLRIKDTRGGRPDLVVPLVIDPDSKRATVTIWRNECEAVLVSEAADRWFSEALDLDCRLVYMPEDSVRPIDPRYAIGEEPVSFADGYPYLILGAASMTDLNKRLDTPIDIIRFRPNLVFTGGEAFMEDHWAGFTIGTERFRGTKPCIRCQIPTIDPATGQSAKEPTRTLAGFRRQDHNILFGLNACWEPDGAAANGRLRIGDPIKDLPPTQPKGI